jgi:hypothetical protein
MIPLTCTVGHNTRHQRSGLLIEGRDRSVLIENEAGVREVVRCAHLNPLGVGGLKLGKADRAAGAARRSGPRSSWKWVVQVVESNC